MLGFTWFIFLFPEFQVLSIISSWDPFKSLQGFNLILFILHFVWSFFFYRSFHEGSTCWFIKDLFPSRGVLQDSFLRNSSFLHIVIRSAFFLSYYWRWYYAILDNLSSCFMIHMLSRMRYFKSIIFFIGIILGYISPKAFL